MKIFIRNNYYIDFRALHYRTDVFHYTKWEHTCYYNLCVFLVSVLVSN